METAVCFSPSASQLLQELKTAKKCIHLCAPAIPVLDALLCEMAVRGLEVTILLRNESPLDDPTKSHAELLAAGVTLILLDQPPSQTGLMDNFLIIDEKTVIMDAGERATYFTIVRENELVAATFLQEFHRLTTASAARLQWQIIWLETDIPALQNEVSSMEKIITDFNYAYTRAFGDTILKILNLKKQKLKQEGNTTRSAKYEKAEADYNTFNEQVEKAAEIELPDLDAAQKSELKAKYRQAVLLCHPDRFQDEVLKSKAHVVFLKLQEAYSKNQLDKLTEILERLEKGLLSADNTPALLNLDELLKRLRYLFQQRQTLLAGIIALQNHQSYKDIISITDMDLFFQQEEQRLSQELKTLQHERV